MGDFVSPNAQCDLQHFARTNLLRHGGVEAGTSLFDVSKVKSRGVGNDLIMIGGAVQIGVVSRNGRPVGDGDGLGICGAEVRVGLAPIADEPAGVNVKMHEVGETARTSGTRCRAPL